MSFVNKIYKGGGKSDPFWNLPYASQVICSQGSLQSKSFSESIPFEGQPFNSNPDNEFNPHTINMSYGRIATIIERGNDLILIISEAELIIFLKWSVS